MRMIMPALSALRVSPATEWPADIKAGTRCRPTAPVAPATKIRTSDLLSLQKTAGSRIGLEFKRAKRSRRPPEAIAFHLATILIAKPVQRTVTGGGIGCTAVGWAP
jgi:hypothetical protein